MARTRTAIQDFSQSNLIYANATVTAYEADVNGNKTTTLATLYSSISGTGELANPQTLDAYGKFLQPVYIEDAVILTITGLGNTPDHDTGVIQRNTYRGSEYYDTDTAITIDALIFFHLIDTASGNVVVTMPDPDDVDSIGQTVVIKRNTGGANTLTVNDIEGGYNVALTAQNDYMMLYSNGSDWFIVSERRT